MITNRDDELVIGVVADTHVPDRRNGLQPNLIPRLKTFSVDCILHAGDICTQPVLNELNAVAPVVAVRGNRDILFYWKLRKKEKIDWNGVRIEVVHGHGGLFSYLVDKYHFWTKGYQFDRYAPKLLMNCPDADVIVYGHTHIPEIRWIDGKLLFNPGSACWGVRYHYPPSFGILRIYSTGIEGQIVNIIDKPRWEALS